jgi:hypothetical protein
MGSRVVVELTFLGRSNDEAAGVGEVEARPRRRTSNDERSLRECSLGEGHYCRPLSPPLPLFVARSTTSSFVKRAVFQEPCGPTQIISLVSCTVFCSFSLSYFTIYLLPLQRVTVCKVKHDKSVLFKVGEIVGTPTGLVFEFEAAPPADYRLSIVHPLTTSIYKPLSLVAPSHHYPSRPRVLSSRLDDAIPQPLRPIAFDDLEIIDCAFIHHAHLQAAFTHRSSTSSLPVLSSYSIFASNSAISLYPDGPLSMTPHCLGVLDCKFANRIHLQTAFTHAIPYRQTTAYLVFCSSMLRPPTPLRPRSNKTLSTHHSSAAIICHREEPTMIAARCPASNKNLPPQRQDPTRTCHRRDKIQQEPATTYLFYIDAPQLIDSIVVTLRRPSFAVHVDGPNLVRNQTHFALTSSDMWCWAIAWYLHFVGHYKSC